MTSARICSLRTLVLGQGAMDARDRAGYGQVDGFLDPEPRRVDHEHGAWPVSAGSFEGVRVGVFEGVSDWAQLEPDEVVESVPAVGGGGEPEPVAGRDCAHRGLEPGGGYVVALVDDDEAVAAEQLGEVVTSREGLQRCHIDGAGELRASATELAGLDAEQVHGSVCATGRRASCGQPAPASRWNARR